MSIIFLFVVLQANGQTFSSNLPILILNTNGQTIQDETRIVANLGIIYNGEGERNQSNGPINSYNGKISIELRGQSAHLFPKKSYRMETQDATGKNLNVSLLGMPTDNDWILYAPYTDKTMMRDVLAYKIGRDLGDYASRTQYVELVIDGDYQGVYVLMENIKRNKNRVDVATLLPQDVTGDELSGGYLLRVDKLDDNDYPGWTATPSPQLEGENDITFQFYDPEGDEMVSAQRNYIRDYIKAVQNSLTNPDFTNEETGFRKYIDVRSALNYMIVNEIGKNVDGYVYSTYFYKEKDSDGGKLHMGPLWDFNLAFGNVDYQENAQYAPGWLWTDQYRMYWFRRMVEDPLFMSNLKCKWQRVRSGFLTNAYFTNTIDSIASLLGESQQRNYVRWPILGTYVWPNQFVGDTYAEEVGFLKQWITDRLVWMDANLAGACEPLITEAEDELISNIEVYPNPFQQTVTITNNNSETVKQLQIFDMTGREVFSTSFSGTEYQWQGNTERGVAVPKGLYIIRVTNNNGVALGFRKIVRQ